MNIKVKDEDGYVLPYALFISFLILTLVSGILYSLFFTNVTNIRKIEKKKLDLACYSALQKIITYRNSFPVDGIVTIDSTDVYVMQRKKGVFREIRAIAKNDRDSSCVDFVMANKLPEILENAIILSGYGAKPVAAGNTEIYGDIIASVPEIEVNSLPGIKKPKNNYMHGSVKTAKNLQERLFTDSVKAGLFELSVEDNEYQHEGDFILDQAAFGNISKNKTIYVAGNLVISGALSYKTRNHEPVSIIVNGSVDIRSNTVSDIDLEIKSSSKVSIGSNCKLANILIETARNIVVDENCYFQNTQLLSMGNIKIIDAKFDYPSIIFIYTDISDIKSLENTISVNSSIINGSVMLMNSVTGLGGNKSRIIIDENSKIQGLLYSENYLECSGQVSGIIYTHGFYYYKEPSEYINWLVNLKINRHELDKSFLMPTGLIDGDNLEILSEKWIY